MMKDPGNNFHFTNRGEKIGPAKEIKGEKKRGKGEERKHKLSHAPVKHWSRKSTVLDSGHAKEWD